MGSIRGVGFDLDGTLFDHRGSAHTAVDKFLKLLGVAPTEELRDAWFTAEAEQFELWRTGQMSFQEQRRQRLRTILPVARVETPTDSASLDDLFAEYLRCYRAAWRLFNDSVDVLHHLRVEGKRVGILTNGTQEQQVDKLHTLGLYEVVDVVCTSERIGSQKPDAGAFLTLADELGLAPEECLFVGDNPTHDVLGALNAGMHALLIDRYGEHKDEGIGPALKAAVQR